MKLYNKRQKTSIRSDVKESVLDIKLFDFGNFDLLNFQNQIFDGINGNSFHSIRYSLQLFNYKNFSLFSFYWDDDPTQGFQLTLFAMNSHILLTLQLSMFDHTFCFSFCQNEAIRFDEHL
jgi:hypothetical protein